MQGKGPWQCLHDHRENPWRDNIFTSSVGAEATLAVVALCLTPIVLEGYAALAEEPWKGKEGTWRGKRREAPAPASTRKQAAEAFRPIPF